MKENLRKLLFWICLLTCIGCIAYIACYYIDRAKSEQEFEQVKNEVVEKPKLPEPEPEKEPEPVDIPIDFASLKGTNPDIYAWIQIPEIGVDTPVLQGFNNDTYYLDHTFDGKYNPVGALFTECMNRQDFTDRITVIYGHNVKSHGLFGNLHKFEDQEFFNNHDRITIYTENQIKEYQIFGAGEYGENHILYSYDNTDPKQMLEFVQSFKDYRTMKNYYREDVVIDEDSKILVLSTCVNGDNHKRYLVGAVEINE